MSREWFRTNAGSAGALLLFVLASSAEAEEICEFTRLTESRGAYLALSLSADGDRFALAADGIAGIDTGGDLDVFHFDGSSFTRVTEAGSSWAFPDDLSANGSSIVLTTTADLTGGNSDGGMELFLWDGDSLSQITSGPRLSPFNPITASLDGEGESVAYSSAVSVNGEPLGSVQVFLWEGETPTQLTHPPGVSGDPQIAPDGARIVFQSNSDFTGGNADGGFDLFLWNRGVITQLTDLGPAARMDNLSVSSDGGRVLFRSPADPVGENPDLGLELFLWDRGTIRQITHLPHTPFGINGRLSGNGERIVYSTIFDPLGHNPDGSAELFLWERGMTTQITDSLVDNSLTAAINHDGTVLLFASGDALGLELFDLVRAECPATSVVEVPVLTPTSLVLLALSLAAVGVRFLR